MTDSATSTNGSPRLTDAASARRHAGRRSSASRHHLGPWQFRKSRRRHRRHSRSGRPLPADRVTLRIPHGSVSGNVLLRHGDHTSNSLPLRVAVPMAEDMHPVSNPVADSDGNVFVDSPESAGSPSHLRLSRRCRLQRPPATPRHSQCHRPRSRSRTTISMFRPDRGTVYRITPDGAKSLYADGMGIATGLAFDKDGNLYLRRPQRHHLQNSARPPDFRLRHPGP